MASLSEKFLNTIEFGNSVHGYLLVSPDTERSLSLRRLPLLCCFSGTDPLNL